MDRLELFMALKDLLDKAPVEDQCSNLENEVYDDMANLKQSLQLLLEAQGEEQCDSKELDASDYLIKPYMFFFVPLIIGVLVDLCFLQTNSQCWFLFTCMLIILTLYMGTVHLYTRLRK